MSTERFGSDRRGGEEHDLKVACASTFGKESLKGIAGGVLFANLADLDLKAFDESLAL
jgi:hypothetical protein